MYKVSGELKLEKDGKPIGPCYITWTDDELTEETLRALGIFVMAAFNELKAREEVI